MANPDPWMKAIFDWGSRDDSAQNAPADRLDPLSQKRRDYQNQKVIMIEKAWALQGGWEGWLQVELGVALAGPVTTMGGKTLIARREVAAYRDSPLSLSKKRADLVIDEEDARGTVMHRVLLEIKCESLYNKDNFRKAVLADVEKITTSQPDVTPCRMYAIAFTMSDEGHQAMRKVPGLKVMDDLGDDKFCPFRLWYLCREV